MFIGHYGAAFGLKSLDRQTPLWVYFLGVQLVDIFFFSFLLMGLEKMNIVPGYTAYNAYDLYCMPYTHSLLGNLLWFAGIAMLSYYLFKKSYPHLHNKAFISVLIGLSVFSHFLADFLVHTPDLPIWNDRSLKIGLGLWNSIPIAMGLELLFLLGGVYLYYNKTELKVNAPFNKRFAGTLLLLIVLTVITPFLPVPGSIVELAVQAIAGYFILAGLVYWVEKV